MHSDVIFSNEGRIVHECSRIRLGCARPARKALTLPTFKKKEENAVLELWINVPRRKEYARVFQREHRKNLIQLYVCWVEVLHSPSARQQQRGFDSRIMQ